MAHLHDVIAPCQRLDLMNIHQNSMIIHRKNLTNMSIGHRIWWIKKSIAMNNTFRWMCLWPNLPPLSLLGLSPWPRWSLGCTPWPRRRRSTFSRFPEARTEAFRTLTATDTGRKFPDTEMFQRTINIDFPIGRDLLQRGPLPLWIYSLFSSCYISYMLNKWTISQCIS